MNFVRYKVGLRLRFALLLTFILLSIFISLAVIMIQLGVAGQKNRLNQQTKIFSQLATGPIIDSYEVYKDSGQIALDRIVARYLDLNNDVLSVQVIDTKGRILYRYGILSGNSKKISIPDSYSNFSPYYVYDANGVIRKLIYPHNDNNGTFRYSVVYSISDTTLQREVTSIINAIFWIGFIAYFVSMTLTYIIIEKFFIHPVRRISHLSSLISAGNLDQRITINRHDEIGDLSRSVDKMALTLSRNIRDLKDTDRLKTEFMMITSHNLRTPLTVVRGYLDMVKDTDDETKRKSYIAIIESNTIRLAQLTENIVSIASLESDSADFKMISGEFKGFIDRIFDDFQRVVVTKNIRINVTNTLQDQQVVFNRGYLKNALWSLLDNAYKFTQENGSIELEASVQNGRIEISIKDSGIGISADELPKLFTKFHRSTDTLRYDYEGVGIGLYLAKLIIEKHGGRIDVSSEISKGTGVTVYLPIIHLDKE